MRSDREPAFNVPPVILATLAALTAAHLFRMAISDEFDLEILLRFAFIPARYDAASPYAADMLGGWGAEVWTFVSYAFLHGDLTHLIVNAVWLLAFGAAVAWRFGSVRFLAFCALTAAAGAATHLAVHFGEPTPVVGASAAISGCMAAAMRFIFEAGGPLGVFRQDGRGAFMRPATPLLVAMRQPQVMVFLAVWFGANIIFGVGAIAIGGEGASIAWEAHIGGFVGGLVLFPLFDPAPASTGRRGSDLPHPTGRPHDDDDGPAERS